MGENALCRGRSIRAANPPTGTPAHSDPMYRLPCADIECRSCLTEHHHAKGIDILSQPITCALCDQPASFPMNTLYPLTFGMLVRPLDWLHQVRSMDILNPRSPHYAATGRIILHTAEARFILSAVYCTVLPARVIELEASTPFLATTYKSIFRLFMNHLGSMPAYSLTTPMLLEAELKDVVLGDIVFDHIVRQPEAPHRMLAPHFQTGSPQDDWRRQADLVSAARRLNPELDGLVKLWEEVLEWVVGAIARRWLDRFGEVGQTQLAVGGGLGAV